MSPDVLKSLQRQASQSLATHRAQTEEALSFLKALVAAYEGRYYRNHRGKPLQIRDLRPNEGLGVEIAGIYDQCDLTVKVAGPMELTIYDRFTIGDPYTGPLIRRQLPGCTSTTFDLHTAQSLIVLVLESSCEPEGYTPPEP